MKILIVSATEFEIKPTLDFYNISVKNSNETLKTISNSNFIIDFLITGVGMVNTAIKITKHLNNNYDFILNVGICGSFNVNFNIGEVVLVYQDIISEMGAEDDQKFITYDKLNLPGTNVYSDSINKNIDVFNKFKKVKGITVNKVHGNNLSINNTVKLFNPDIESMEGAAFFAACSETNTEYCQIRAISNFVEKRNKNNWNIPLAIKNLNNELINYLETKIWK